MIKRVLMASGLILLLSAVIVVVGLTLFELLVPLATDQVKSLAALGPDQPNTQAEVIVSDASTSESAVPTTPSSAPESATIELPATPVSLPTATPQPLAATEPVSPPTTQPVPQLSAKTLSGFRHYWQTWNNCGPATLAMNLSYFGGALDQAAIGATLRPNPEDKNVNPQELAAFARQQGYAAAVRVNGDVATLRALLDNGLPALIETWLEPEPNDGLGHYRLLVGYDDVEEHWIAYDSYVGVNLVNPEGEYQGIKIAYDNFDSMWKVFNRTFVLLFPPERRPLVESILGGPLDEAAMWQAALANADQELVADPGDAFAHFNRGSALAALGDHPNAAAAFDRARELGLPWRMLWYQFGPFESYAATGRYQDVIQLTDTILAPDVQIEELFYWRNRALEALGDAEAAREAMERAVYLNPNYANGISVMPPGTPIGSWE